jgi:hypothetical protein
VEGEADLWIILKRIRKGEDVVLWIFFVWLRIGSGGEFL